MSSTRNKKSKMIVIKIDIQYSRLLTKGLGYLLLDVRLSDLEKVWLSVD